MNQFLSKLSSASLNFIFPIYCQGCGIKLSCDNRDHLCNSCIKDIKYKSAPFCIRCGKSLNGNKDIETICPSCLNKKFYFDKAWQCCKYDGIIKELIHKFKYNKKLFLKKALVDILYDFFNTNISYNIVDSVFCVPMHKTSIGKRGFNQAGLLARGLSERLKLPFYADGLLKLKKTKQQMGLKKDERLNNIKGVFSVKKDMNLKKKKILLIDDVFTTASTVNECSKILKQAGAESVYVLALARGI